MEVSSNYISKLINKDANTVQQTKNEQSFPLANSQTTMLPSVHVAGQSQINSNIPVSYTKIGEINIPGLKEKASLFKLENGQKVAILPKKGPTIVKTTYNVGSLNETDDIRGISHYIEHNLFNGSKGLAPREYDKRVSELGGYTNASTCYNYTDYYLSLQLHNENSLEEAIKLNSMQTQYPTFPQEQLEKEKGPVKSEINMYLDKPCDVSTATATNNLFNIKTKATNAVIGTEETINGMTREKVLDYFNTWYTPDNAVTVITGDVNVDETINLVSKYFNKQNDYSNISKRHYEPLKPIEKTIRKDIISKNSSSAYLAMGFAIPEGTSQEDRIKIDTLISILTASNSSLTKALEKYGLYIDVFNEKLQNKPDSAETIMFNTPLSEHQVEEVIKILYEEINKIANTPPTQEALDGIKKKSIYALNNSGERSTEINSILTNMIVENDLNYFANANNIIQSLSPQDISNTAKKFLDLNKTSICVAHAKDATTESIQQNYNKTNSNVISFGSSAKINESFDDTIKEVSHFKLRNNIETRILPCPSTAKSTMMVSLSTNELNNFPSAAFDVLSILLNRGNMFKTNETVENMKNSKDFSLGFACDSTGIEVFSNFYTQDMNEAMGLFKETLMYPNFTQEEFNRAKEIIKDNLLSSNPSSFDNLMAKLFGNKIKDFATREQKLQEIDALSLYDIQVLYSQLINTAQVNASISAPVKEYPYLQDIINSQLSSGLPVFNPVTKIKSNSYYIYEPNTQPKIIVEANENKQAKINQAYTFRKSGNVDDAAKIYVLATLLGGGMSSRLFKDLREDQKLAYAVSAETFNRNDTGVILMSIGTTTDSEDPNEGSPENITKSLNGFEKHVNMLKTTNISQEELDNIKIQIKTDLLNSNETNYDKLSNIHSNIQTPYDINFSKALLEAIDRITVEDIKSTANYVFANPPVTSIVASQKTLDTLNLK